ncbi:MAG: 30S ribosomal protein S16 [Candidatus Yanofskybacteria bacterium GW2011_GWA1_48_10]|uniref:Small ribosomal subunit protein bS16 n=2 Tax=Candidatus Yanofskyibacteriota TaxID=1752733 RepID=A0A0G1WHC3_9BACT|nr:MAG: 30S ribosomal protein S16 [Candidatus Yanofskybacteria bacterium GW2011_GWA1_48_10]
MAKLKANPSTGPGRTSGTARTRLRRFNAEISQERTAERPEVWQSDRQVITMLVMRLQRIGKRGQAYFRIIVTEHTKKPQGEYLELLGSYDPHKKNLRAKKERIEYWMSQGVRLSPTVNNLLVNNHIINTAKMVSWKPKVKPVTDDLQSTTKVETKAEEKTEEVSAEPEVAQEPAQEPQADENTSDRSQ